MKKFLMVFAITTVGILAHASFSHSNRITVTLYETSKEIAELRMNDNRDVVWTAQGDFSYIFFHDGTRARKMGVGSDPQINKKGQVAWRDSGSILYYDGKHTVELATDSEGRNSPQLNDKGHVVWSGYDGSDYEIFVYNGEETIQLTNNSAGDKSPTINNSDFVAWIGYDDSRNEQLYLYNGVATIQLTNNDLAVMFNSAPLINDEGWIVWFSIWDYETEQVFLYNNKEVIKLSSCANCETGRPEINNQGDVVLSRSLNDSVRPEIYLYTSAESFQLTETPYVEEYPQINDGDQVVWQGFDGSDWEIFLYDGKKTIQLTDNSHDDYLPQINNNGDITWVQQDGSNYRIQLSTASVPTFVSTGGGGGG